MPKSTLLKTLLTLLMVSFVLMMVSPSSRSSWGAEARYLPTRSDPLSPVGPPRGEYPRFDRLYDIIREILQNGGGELTDEVKYPVKNQFGNGPY